MVRSDKKSDDHDEPPASWIAQRTPGYRIPHEPATARKRPDTSNGITTITTTTKTTTDKPEYYSSARRLWQPRHDSNSISRSSRSEKSAWHNTTDDSSSYAPFCDLENERSCPAVTAQLPRSKPFRRMLLLLLGVLGLGYFCWRQAVGPLVGADWHVREGFVRSYRGTYGFAMGGDFDVAENRVVELDASLIPGGTADPDAKRRLVFVGDIHGCKPELDALLEACAFDARSDHLIATGDVISKGPDSPGVVDELIRLNATSVRGNHEDRILSFANIRTDPAINGAKDMTPDATKDTTLLKSLHQRHLDYLRNMPLILRIPALPLAHVSTQDQHLKNEPITSEILVVHAGLVPAVPLRQQDPFSVMNMRSLARRTHVPSSLPATSKDRDSLPWIELWNWYHTRLDKGEALTDWRDNSDAGIEQQDHHPQTWLARIFSIFHLGPFKRRHKRHHPQVVVYGHDSKAGLVIKPWSKGLDSGAVKGGELTAMVLDARGQVSMFSVKSKDYTS